MANPINDPNDPYVIANIAAQRGISAEEALAPKGQIIDASKALINSEAWGNSIDPRSIEQNYPGYVPPSQPEGISPAVAAIKEGGLRMPGMLGGIGVGESVSPSVAAIKEGVLHMPGMLGRVGTSGTSIGLGVAGSAGSARPIRPVFSRYGIR